MADCRLKKLKWSCFDHLTLEFGIYLGFEIWDLEFEIMT
jgi:hypothetical protein